MTDKELRLDFRGTSDEEDEGGVVDLPDLQEEELADGDGFGSDEDAPSEFSEF